MTRQASKNFYYCPFKTLSASRNVELLSNLSPPVVSLKVLIIFLWTSLLKKEALPVIWMDVKCLNILTATEREITVMLFDREENELPRREWGIVSEANKKTSAPVAGAKSHPRGLPNHWVSPEPMPSHCLLNKRAWRAVCIRAIAFVVFK